MVDIGFLPTLSSSVIERAIKLIEQANQLPNQHISPDDIKHVQQELFEMQKHWEAWGLIVPFLNHPGKNVEFYRAHTAQVKIARDWAAFPERHATALRDVLMQLTAHSIVSGKRKFILRKLFVALCSLALRLVPHPTRWPQWILACITTFSGTGAPTEHILDFPAIVAEEIESADLIGQTRHQMMSSLNEALPVVLQAITDSINAPLKPVSQITAALSCFSSWMPNLRGNEITNLLPQLTNLLDPTTEAAFLATINVFVDILSRSHLRDGGGTKTFTRIFSFG